MSKSKHDRKKSIPEPNEVDIRLFKDTVLPGEKVTIRAIPESPVRKKKSKSTKFFYGRLTKISTALIEANLKGYMVGVIPQLTDGNGTEAENITEILCVYIDVDSKFDKKALLELPIPPHLIYETSPGRGVAIWLVEDCGLDMFAKVQRALATKLGGDMSRTSPASMVRFPGSIHWKDQPFQSHIVHHEKKAKPLKVKKLVKGLKLKVDEEPHDAAPTSKAIESEVSPAKIESALNALPLVVLDDRNLWVKVGMAVHSAMPDDSGLALFAAASSKSEKYVEKELRRQWKSFDANGKVKIATLFHLAAQNGWSWKDAAAETDFPHTEFDLTPYIAKRLRENLVYDKDTKTWFVFDGHVFRIDEGQVLKHVQAVLQGGMDAARNAGDTVAFELMKKYANHSGLKILLSHCGGHESVSVEHVKFNSNPYLFAVANGVIDLRTGNLRPGTPEDLITRRSDVVFDPKVEAVLFKKYLKEVTAGDKEFQNYLQSQAGYALIGSNNAQKIPVFLGPGGQGKGVFMRVVKNVMKEYATTVPPNLLSGAYSGNPNSPTPALAVLDGPRLLMCTEGMERKNFDSAFMKQVAGGDEFSARTPYGGQFSFTPIGKLWLSTNSLPHIDSTDQAMWRRLVVMPFDEKVRERDDNLTDKLKLEASGILNWMLGGAKNFIEKGMPECAKVEKATSKARKSGDTVATWLEERCKLKEGGKTKASEAYASYKSHTAKNGLMPLTIQQFPQAMLIKGIAKKSASSNNYYHGVVLRD